jgi:uncharacterized protein YceH (UPF0502 family)
MSGCPNSIPTCCFVVFLFRCYYLPMALQLSDVEARVLGALVEKEITTREYYPLSLNALVNACNQKSNREPVMSLAEDAVRSALRSLSDQALARSAGGDSRVAKYEHRLNELYNFHRHEIAVLCVLLLRGPQTPGELRTRAERMYAFEDLEAVHTALNLLARREPPLVKVLPREPGTKESRYVHLLSGDTVLSSASHDHRSVAADKLGSPEQDNERLQVLEQQVSDLRKELEALHERFADFRKQFQ